MNRSAQIIEPNPTTPGRGHDDSHDRALLRRYVQDGDSQAVGELLARHAHAAFRLACQFSANSSDAEDSVQVAALNILNRAGQFDERREGAVRLWIMGIVVNVCRKKRLENTRRAAREVRAAALRPVVATPAEDMAMENDQVRHAVAQAVRTLPGLYRTPLSLHYYEGMTSTEVAAVLQIPESTIRSQLKRGIEQLRAMLTASGISLSVADLGLLAASLKLEQAPASLLSSLQKIVDEGKIPARKKPRGKRTQPRRENSATWKIAAGCTLVAIILLLLLNWGPSGSAGTGGAKPSGANVAQSAEIAHQNTPDSDRILQHGAAMPDAASAQKDVEHLAPVVDPGLADPLKHPSPPTNQTEEKDPMKSKIKNGLMGVALATAVATAGGRSVDAAQPQPAAAVIAAGAVPQLVDPGSPDISAYAAIPDVSAAIDHLDALVRGFNPMVPAGMLKAQLGAMLNDPALDNLDASKPVVFMVFNVAADAADGPPPFAIFIPAKAEAPYQQLAATTQSVSAFKDGLFILAPTEEILTRAQAQTAAYGKIAAAKASADTRIYASAKNLMATYGQKLAQKMQNFTASFGQQQDALQASGGLDPAGVTRLLNLELKGLVEMVAEIDAQQFDLTIKGDAITLDSVVNAKPDSALAALLSAPPPGAPKMLNMLTASGMMAYTAHVDPVASQKCVNKLFDTLAKDPEFAGMLTPDVKDFVAKWVLLAGDLAGSTSIQPQTGTNTEIAMTVTDEKDVAAVYAQMASVMGPNGLFNKLYAGTGMNLTATLERSARNYKGVEIMRYKPKMDTGKLTPETASQMTMFVKDMEIGVANHTYVAANNPPDLDKMIDKALAGDTATPSVSLESITVYGAGKQAYFDYNLVALLKSVFESMPNNPMAAVFAQLSESKPIIGAADCDSGRARMQMSVPLAPLIQMSTLAIAQQRAAAAPPPPPEPKAAGKDEKF